MSEAREIEARFTGRFGDFTLDAAFTAPARGITALFGPSGCGKTTVLRCMAGLQPANGSLRIGREIWQDGPRALPAHRRAVGYVFQEASLFPHLDVRENLLFGRRRAGIRPGQPELRLEEVVALLGISALLQRAPDRLSGGERQRVAIGRALLSQPALLLMDEPLAALDRAAREEILPFLERLHETLAIPVIYVSHDLGEVERLADHLVLMEAGRVVASGALADLQGDVRLPLARGRDAAVTLAARTLAYDAQDGLLTLTVDGGSFTVPAPPAPAGEARRLRVAAGDVSIALTPPADSSILNVLPCRIETLAGAGPAETMAVLRLGEAPGGARLLARLTRRSCRQLALREGLQVQAQVKGVALVSSRAPA